MSATIPPIPNSESGVVTWNDVEDNLRSKDLQWLQARSVIRFTNQAEVDDYPDSQNAVPTMMQEGQVVYLSAPNRLIVNTGTEWKSLLASTNLRVSENEGASTISFGDQGGLTINSDGTINLPGGSALDLNNLSVASGKVVLNTQGVNINTHGGAAVTLSSETAGLVVGRALRAAGLNSTAGLAVSGISTLGAVTSSGVDVSGTLTATTVNVASNGVTLNSSGLAVGSTLRAGSGLANGDGTGGSTVVNPDGVWTPGVYARTNLTVGTSGYIVAGSATTAGAGSILGSGVVGSTANKVTGTLLESTTGVGNTLMGNVHLRAGGVPFGVVATNAGNAFGQYVNGNYWELVGPQLRSGGAGGGQLVGPNFASYPETSQAGTKWFVQTGSFSAPLYGGQFGLSGYPAGFVPFRATFPNGVIAVFASISNYDSGTPGFAKYYNVTTKCEQANGMRIFVTFNTNPASDPNPVTFSWMAIGW